MSSTPLPQRDASPMVGAVNRSVDQAQGSAHRAIDSAAQSIAPAVDRASAGAHHAVDAIAGATSHAAESIGARGEQLHQVQARLSESLRVQLREHPMATLGIAVAAGALLSWALRSR